MSTLEDLQRQITELKREKEEAEARVEQERCEKEEAEARAAQERLGREEAEARADLLQRREAPTRFLDYIQSIEQHLFTTFSIEPDSSQTSASSTTSVEGRFYPQHFQHWTDFTAVHNATFDTFAATFGERECFPALTYVQSVGQDLSPKVSDELALRPFIRASIEKPAATLVTKYLEIAGHDKFTSVKFRGNSYGLSLTGKSTEEAAEELPEPAPKRQSPFKEIGVPDRWLVASFRDGQAAGKMDHILVGEIKPAHVLNGVKLNRVLSAPPGDDFFLRATGQDGASTSGRVPGEVYVAKALCQAFHYMVTSGLEFGYVASGEGLVFLRVPEKDPNTLYYFGSVFPANRDPDTTATREPRATAMAHLATLCMLSTGSTRRPMGWIDASKDVLRRWPKTRATVPSLAEKAFPILPHDRSSGGGSSGDGGGSVGGSAGGGEPGPSNRGALKRPRSHGSSPTTTTGGHTAAALGTGARQTRLARPFIVEPPTLPYCTQACLRSLCRGQVLDTKCPNAELHQAAAASKAHHALTAGDVRARVVSQLAENMDKDCESLLYSGHFGRYGVLFKITVSGFGYTLVAKAVQQMHRSILQHEAGIYSALDTFQGRLVPVCLGLVDLERSLPLRNCQWVSHMLLMSYAGADICSRNIPPGVDVELEAEKTHKELWAAGLLNGDIHDANLAWNEEAHRVMQFDFDDACMQRVVSQRSPLQEKRSLNAFHEGSQWDENDKLKRARSAV